MDSGNSGSLSLQSSSGGGGDDEFDSRCGGEDSSPLSALLRHPLAPSSSVLPDFGGPSFYGVHDLPAPPLSHWSSTPPVPSSSSSSAATHSSSSLGAPAPPSADHSAAAGPVQQAAPATRSSRKRTRASRRAPTTVLTTDTSNFRAMVQEFTGIPAPPFAGARSLDHLFPSALSSPYLLRPFPRKIQHAAYPPPAYVATSSVSPAIKAIAASTAARTTAAVASSSDSYRHLASQTAAAALGMQDHGSGGNYLTFQQSPLGGRYPAAQPMFDATGFSGGLAHGQMNSRHGGDELSGLVGAASNSKAADACNKATSFLSGAGTAANRAGPPRLERNAQSTTTTTIAAGAATTTTAAMGAQGVESSWICTSE